MLRLEDIHKVYRNGHRSFEVIRGVTATIQDGEFVVLLGASGSGKSTLLSLMSGLEVPDSGTVTWEDQCISGMSDKNRTRFRRKHVGFVFQQYGLLEQMTAGANVRLGADLVGNGSWKESLDAVGIGNMASELCSRMSGGEQQRVAIARALAKKPRVLFLDEPTGALDEKTGREVLGYLEKLHDAQHFTMIMVTHNEHIAEMADIILHMNSGRIVSAERNASRRHADEIGW